MKILLRASIFAVLAALLIAPIRVFADEGSESLQVPNPYVCISSYSIEKGLIEAGSGFVLKVDVENVSPVADAYNVLVSYFFTGNGGFYQADGETNQRFIEYIPANETKSIYLNLQAMDVITSRVVLLEFNLAYLNEEATPYSNQTNIAVYQQNKSELQVVSVSLPDTVYTDSKSLVDIQFENTGKVRLDDVVLLLNGHFEGSPLKFDIGTLGIGEHQMIDTYLQFVSEGADTLTLQFDYVNEFGDKFTLSEESAETYVRQRSPGAADGISDVQSGNDIVDERTFWLYICIASGVLLAIFYMWFLRGFLYRRWKGLKK